MPQNQDQTLLLDGPAGTIEAVLKHPKESRAGLVAVVCHPHPQHGGTMDNKVVTTLVRTFNELGIPCLKFNFRGVGKSQGQHDQGRGEVEDLKVVVGWLKENLAVDQIVLAGFSFGSGVASNGCHQIPGVIHGVFVAPPVGRYNFSTARSYPCPVTLVMGDKDELVDPGQAYSWAQSLQPPAMVLSLPEASHFFHGQLVIFREKLAALLKTALKLA